MLHLSLCRLLLHARLPRGLHDLLSRLLRLGIGDLLRLGWVWWTHGRTALSLLLLLLRCELSKLQLLQLLRGELLSRLAACLYELLLGERHAVCLVLLLLLGLMGLELGELLVWRRHRHLLRHLTGLLSDRIRQIILNDRIRFPRRYLQQVRSSSFGTRQLFKLPSSSIPFHPPRRDLQASPVQA